MQTVYLPMTPQLNTRSIYSEEKGLYFGGARELCLWVLGNCLGGMCWWFFAEVVWFGLFLKIVLLVSFCCWFNFSFFLILWLDI